VEDHNMTFFEKLIGNFDVFDSIHFGHVASQGYQTEINHAFFPLFPLVVDSIIKFVGTHKIVGFWLQILLSYANTLLLYRVGKKVFGHYSEAEKIAVLSARFYFVGHSAVYQVAFYSENLFLFLTLIGFSIMYSDKSSG
jgi:hypothetical protein